MATVQGSDTEGAPTPPPGLRARKKRRSREQIRRAARELFLERGFEGVSVAEIARRAGVAEKTVFNHFPTKEDLAYEGMEQWERDLLRAVRERPAGQSVLDAFAAFVSEPGGILTRGDEQAEILVEFSRLVLSSPALLRRESQIIDHYTGSLARELVEQLGTNEADLRPWIAANAMMGVHRALLMLVRRRLVEGVPPAQVAEEVRVQARAGCALLAEGLSALGA